MKKIIRTYFVMLFCIALFGGSAAYSLYKYDPNNTLMFLILALVCAALIVSATIYYITLRDKNRD